MEQAFQKGDKVHYTAPHGTKENGKVKEVRETIAFVVYKCNNEWDNYENYTGQSTQLSDLTPGWVENEKS